MSKKLIAATAITLFAGIATAADTFSALDTDQNGVIGKQEAAASPALTAQWGMLDVDASGDLSAAEFAKYQTEEKETLEAKDKLSGVN